MDFDREFVIKSSECKDLLGRLRIGVKGFPQFIVARM
jgi:hypothetical protein